jgi:hypothetical protein
VKGRRLSSISYTWPLLAIVTGCAPRVPSLSAAPVHQGIFLVTAQQQAEPVVEVENETPVTLHLIMNRSDGKVVTLDVWANSNGHVDVPTGHYDAKVFDTTGQIKSAYGTADITEYRKYQADFITKNGGEYKFHIGG